MADGTAGGSDPDVEAWLDRYEVRRARMGWAGPLAPSTLAYYQVLLRSLMRRRQDEESLAQCAARLYAGIRYVGARAALYWWIREELTAPSLFQDRDHARALLALALELESLAIPKAHRRARLRRSACRHLPTDWREQLIASVPSARRPELLVLALTGCRPLELKRGVSVSRFQGLVPCLRLAIAGVKVSTFTGQPWRMVTVSAKAPFARDLAAALWPPGIIEADEVEVSTPCRTSTFAAWVRRRAERLWPEGPRVTPYTFRYQFALDLRQAGASPWKLAQALGHQDVASQNNYVSRYLRPPRRSRAVQAGRPVPGPTPSITAAMPVRSKGDIEHM